jgi:hypothetical protein
VRPLMVTICRAPPVPLLDTVRKRGFAVAQ